ncbi:hypothetical protein NDU88_008587 [Pleurodeles waltl]|uniref:Uncharacterized protein n=1 Tax=Pleurodeles waltl TaxID=8319 RepID=A0AAV7PPW9_PLEWA|nr:hypothetical protein NDU88_008587 [Pleurodeles waltl]
MGGGGSAGHQIAEPGCLSSTSQGGPQEHSAVPARASDPIPNPPLTWFCAVSTVQGSRSGPQGTSNVRVQAAGGNTRDHHADPSAGPKFRPSPPSVTVLSESAYYRPGPARSCRGPGDQKARRETPAEGRELPMRPEPPAAARTRSQSAKEGEGGGAAVRNGCRSGSPGVPRAPVLSPLDRGGGRSLPPLRAHHGSRRARTTAGARPLSAPQPPGCPQQPNPARTASSESPGGSPRGLLLHCRM